MAAVGLLILGATLGLSVDAIGDVPADFRRDLQRELGARIEDLEGTTVVADEVGGDCMAGSQCVADLRSRTSSLDVVMLRIIGGPIRLRLVAERTTETDRSLSTELEVRRDHLDTAAIVVELARALGFEATAVGARRPVAESRTEINWLAVSMTGVGLAAMGTAVAFGVSSRSASSEVSAPGLDHREILRLDDRADRDALVANVLFGVAASAVIGGLLSWAFQ